MSAPDSRIRRAPRLLWLSVSLALIALLLALCSLSYLVYRDWRDEQQDNLIQEVLWLEQSLRMHLEGHQEWADGLARDIAAGKVDSQRFAHLAAFYMRENPELLTIERVDASNQVQWDQHGIRRDRRSLGPAEFDGLWRASRLLRSSYGAPYQGADGKYRFDLAVPVVRDGQLLGGLRFSYQLDGLLYHQVPWWIASKNYISILDLGGKTLAQKFDAAERPGNISHQTSFDPPGYGLYLRAVAYRSGLGLTLPVLTCVIVLLLLTLWYAVWRIRRHMRERATAEQKLAQEVSLRQAIEDSMKSGLVAIGLEGEIVRVNRAFCDMLGFAPEELVGSYPPHPFWPADQHGVLADAMDAVRDNRQPEQGFELALMRKRGDTLVVRLFATPLVREDGSQHGWIASMFDITERQRQRKEMDAAHRRFLTVLNGLAAGVCVVAESSGQLLYANPGFAELWLVGDADAPCCVLLPGLRAGPENEEYGQEFIVAGECCLLIRRRRIEWVNGEAAWLAILSDVSEDRRREAREQAQQDRFQNTARLIAMGEMASTLAHELNQPLTAIHTYAAGVSRRLPEQLELPAGVRDAIHAIAEQSRRAAQIVSSIRAFVKKHEPQLERVDPARAVARALSLAEPLAAKHGVSLQLEPDRRACLLDMDPVLIEQVLLNLMKNAVEALVEADTPQPSVQLHTCVGEGKWRVEVVDNGPGLAAGMQDNLFTPFYSTKPEGMGIGLNICRSIVEFHRGEFGAVSSPAGGCVFWFTLPLAGRVVE
ncbi:PAS domain-containing sensor histidine kinase [Chromobacterium subtsugae]|uniref:histidine kinase n=2 Tax=Chromobacterium subtsugae TaxID=251747 RepID=A0ABS7FIN2_9NEIS|nr:MULTISPECIES: PAS domain-containing sensor histidine kinase [Chromobacterium]KUM03791.1 histidine kinase [Chromobacterium subtsugae]KZE85544.1 histidine kinase [Chromobacterium sp. F49]MBW7568945.1 PAS domain S-box protein [Chromobacterium subtsugae]MBW8289935.1 PAS domain-containing sensor histidine kinase [Chromobacterium subtsugae]WSE92494.1 PAS domain-containing sensor histidine kinase [Chromobacterium subtsugae]